MTNNSMKALIIAEPWISLILGGTKTWEMRSRPTNHRGPLGLIRKGSGAVFGVAELAGCRESLSQESMIQNIGRHRIPEELIRSGAVAKWNCPWVLSGTRTLTTPVPYKHKSGAVTWVDLGPEVTAAINSQLA